MPRSGKPSRRNAAPTAMPRHGRGFVLGLHRDSKLGQDAPGIHHVESPLFRRGIVSEAVDDHLVSDLGLAVEGMGGEEVRRQRQLDNSGEFL